VYCSCKEESSTGKGESSDFSKNRREAAPQNYQRGTASGEITGKKLAFWVKYAIIPSVSAS
jgi:hypothetical protein